MPKGLTDIRVPAMASVIAYPSGMTGSNRALIMLADALREHRTILGATSGIVMSILRFMGLTVPPLLHLRHTRPGRAVPRDRR